MACQLLLSSLGVRSLESSSRRSFANTPQEEESHGDIATPANWTWMRMHAHVLLLIYLFCSWACSCFTKATSSLLLTVGSHGVSFVTSWQSPFASSPWTSTCIGMPGWWKTTRRRMSGEWMCPEWHPKHQEAPNRPRITIIPHPDQKIQKMFFSVSFQWQLSIGQSYAINLGVLEYLPSCAIYY